MDEKIEEIEKYKDDSIRMFQVIRQLQPKERKKILVHTENGVKASEKKQIEIIKNHFKEVFQRREDEIKRYRTNRDEKTIHRSRDKKISEQVEK